MADVGRPVWPMAIALALLTMVLSLAGHGFTTSFTTMTRICVTENPDVQCGFFLGVSEMGLYEHGTGGLSAAAHAPLFPHRGVPVVWIKSVGPSPDQCAAALGQHRARFFGLLARMTGAPLAESFMLAALFAMASPARRVGGLGDGKRKDGLSMFFGMMALLAYSRYAAGRNIEHRTSNTEHRTKEGRGQKSEGRGQMTALRHPTSAVRFPSFILHLPSSFWWYGLSLVCFACGLMSKAMVVTVPFVMLLLDWWPLARTTKCEVRSAKADQLSTINYQPSTIPQLVLEKIPFFVLAAAATSASFTFWCKSQGGAVVALEKLSLADAC